MWHSIQAHDKLQYVPQDVLNNPSASLMSYCIKKMEAFLYTVRRFLMYCAFYKFNSSLNVLNRVLKMVSIKTLRGIVEYSRVHSSWSIKFLEFHGSSWFCTYLFTHSTCTITHYLIDSRCFIYNVLFPSLIQFLERSDIMFVSTHSLFSLVFN